MERRPPHPSAASFPIVAVGASAGGLAPTVELLRSLGSEPKVAVVVVHHLDPTHESGLVEVLSRATVMSVATAVDGARVEVNHVYVVPPNAGLLIVQGALKVVPRLEEGGLHLPIDRFFESLALDCDGLSVGVVSSGSGFDGTEGVKAIKREGGRRRRPRVRQVGILGLDPATRGSRHQLRWRRMERRRSTR
jgi:two-component system CheB/CheR fusion protein